MNALTHTRTTNQRPDFRYITRDGYSHTAGGNPLKFHGERV